MRRLISTIPVTAREAEVLKGLVRGDSNAEISRRMRIQEQTVKNHVSVLLRKLKVRNRVQLAVLVATGRPPASTTSAGRKAAGTRQ